MIRELRGCAWKKKLCLVDASGCTCHFMAIDVWVGETHYPSLKLGGGNNKMMKDGEKKCWCRKACWRWMEEKVTQGFTGRREELASYSSDDLGGLFLAY